jgi:hypothetical protein
MITEQGRVSIPTVKDGQEWPFLFRIYLSCVTWTLRKLIAYLTGPNEGHDLEVKISTPGLGAGYVICNVWLPRPVDEIQTKHPLVLVLEGGGFVLGHPKDGRLNNRRIVEQVCSLQYAQRSLRPKTSTDRSHCHVGRLRQSAQIPLPSRFVASIWSAAVGPDVLGCP